MEGLITTVSACTSAKDFRNLITTLVNTIAGGQVRGNGTGVVRLEKTNKTARLVERLM